MAFVRMTMSAEHRNNGWRYLQWGEERYVLAPAWSSIRYYGLPPPCPCGKPHRRRDVPRQPTAKLWVQYFVNFGVFLKKGNQRHE